MTCVTLVRALSSDLFVTLADLSRAGSVSLNNFTCTLESHRQLLFLIRGCIMSPKICIVSEILHLKHKAQLPHIFIFDFEHNY